MGGRRGRGEGASVAAVDGFGLKEKGESSSMSPMEVGDVGK